MKSQGPSISPLYPTKASKQSEMVYMLFPWDVKFAAVSCHAQCEGCSVAWAYQETNRINLHVFIVKLLEPSLTHDWYHVPRETVTYLPELSKLKARRDREYGCHRS